MLEVQLAGAAHEPPMSYRGRVVFAIQPATTAREIGTIPYMTKCTVSYDTGQRQVLSSTIRTELTQLILNVPANAKVMILELETDAESYMRSVFMFNPTPIVSIDEWDTYPLRRLAPAARQLVSVPPKLPYNLTNFTNLLSSCSSLNDPNVSQWDTSRVREVTNALTDCTAFNQSLDNWHLPEAVDAYAMLYNCSNFNKPMPHFNPEKLTSIHGMLGNCAKFNQDLSGVVFKSSIARTDYDKGCVAWSASYRPKFIG